ncbi:MAG: hypothetical protein IPI41_11960 [Flavobacteriales bacterium]|nr:hypothetical protein [Flavobacteriales bacterium]
MPQRVRSSSPRSASLIVALVIATGTLAQNIGINSDGAAAHASALLDVSVAALPANAKKGLLVPRMTTAQRNAIPTPAEALLVYDTSLNQFWYYDGVQWAAIATLGNLWSTTGNVGTLVIHSIGTTAGSTTMEFRVNDQRAAYMADAVTRTSFGHGAMPVATGTNSSAFGKDALQSLTSGNNNTALGASALRNLTTAGSNTAIGFEALHMNTGGRNTAVGYRALTANTSGTDSTAVGYLAFEQQPHGQLQHGRRLPDPALQYGQQQYGRGLERAPRQHQRQLEHGRGHAVPGQQPHRQPELGHGLRVPAGQHLWIGQQRHRPPSAPSEQFGPLQCGLRQGCARGQHRIVQHGGRHAQR